MRGNRLLTVENLAEESRASIRALRPSGPYILGAYCGAAPLAYETALQLMAEGEQVPVLMLFDAPAPGYPNVRDHISAYLTHAIKIPVSYTHLDVYKRQARGAPLPEIGRAHV